MNFLSEIATICGYLLPLLGVIALSALIIVLLRLAKVLQTTDSAIEDVRPSIQLVETTLDKVQGPVDTAVKVAGGLDKAYDSSLEAVKAAKEQVTNGARKIKEKVNEYVKKDEEVVREPSPDDILRGE